MAWIICLENNFSTKKESFKERKDKFSFKLTQVRAKSNCLLLFLHKLLHDLVSEKSLHWQSKVLFYLLQAAINHSIKWNTVKSLMGREKTCKFPKGKQNLLRGLSNKLQPTPWLDTQEEGPTYCLSNKVSRASVEGTNYWSMYSQHFYLQSGITTMYSLIL